MSARSRAHPWFRGPIDDAAVAAFDRWQRDRARAAFDEAIHRAVSVLDFARRGLSPAADEYFEGIIEHLQQAEPAGGEWWRGDARGDLINDQLHALEVLSR